MIIKQPSQLVDELRQTFRSGKTRALSWRSEQLLALKRMLVDNEPMLAAALEADLGKSPIEAYTTEIGFCLNEIDHALKNLGAWVEPRKVKVPLSQRPGRAEVIPEPRGVTFIIAPWNYPLHLLVAPLTAAIAAGNTVVAKPSELSPATSKVLGELIPKYLDDEAIALVEGDASVAEALLEVRFDHIFFTGGGRIATKVLAAAAPHLTPVTLELGGKSPALVDASANLASTARRIAFGRFLNAGQTCVAPDYVLVHRSQEEELVGLIAETVGQFFGENPQESPDYGRIINEHHARRLANLIDEGGWDHLVIGGQVDIDDRYIAPTVMSGVDLDSAVMADEIFGPILPVIAVDSMDDAIDIVNDRPQPLSLYIFSEDDNMVEHIIGNTSSGGVCVNHTLLQLGVPDLPFGGVGPSGMGAYHGQAGFEEFSHLKSVFHKASKPDPSIMYPPYSKLKTRIIRAAL
ncbi:MAG: aldehyde dehydrogenase family protein [Acidimicrobiia bacterium]